MSRLMLRYRLPCSAPHAQRGIVLIMSLIMLVVISLLATLSMRSATSSEMISGNVRTTMLANQAAEIALRYCENTTLQVSGGAAAPANFNILPSTSPARWKSTANWDTVSTNVFPVPIALVNQAGLPTFKRGPECMVERVQVVNSTGTATSNTSTYVITSRGFGPEVADDAARGRPTGSEVWMQSTIELQ